MTLLAIPNVSEGTDLARIRRMAEEMQTSGTRVLDIHSDAAHNRSVFTITAAHTELIAACVGLARSAAEIDLTRHRGIHPRLGGLDVCPFVPHGTTSIDEAIVAARSTAQLIGDGLGLPVYLYGEAALREETRALHDLRRGGLQTLSERAAQGLEPDAGPARIDPHRGVVCVGARGPLIAFNVWLASDLVVAGEIAARVRSTTVRALGLPLEPGRSQVSMNLIDPAVTGIEEAFAAVADLARERSVEISGTEIVGLVEARFLPNPDATVTRLLMRPGHSLESVLQGSN